MRFRKSCSKLSLAFEMLLTFTVLPFLAFACAWAEDTKVADSFQEFFSKGSPYLNLRYRFEFVDEAALTQQAKASTLRSDLGFRSARWRDLEGLIEFQDVSEIGADNFNNTINGKVNYPTVADVDGSEVNQSYISYHAVPKTSLGLGRKVLKLDNERFIGDSGWRQNNQTFDGFNLSSDFFPEFSLVYARIFNVNRVFGEDSTVGDLSSDIDLINLKHFFSKDISITAYSYLLDFDHIGAPSSASYGGRFDGSSEFGDEKRFLYETEYARQTEYASQTSGFSANYYHVSGALEAYGVASKLGYELLGSDSGKAAFQTPLATLHRWNGWADKFLTTPNQGLQDIYGSVRFSINKFVELSTPSSLAVVYHDFQSDDAGVDFGTEWDFEISHSFTKEYVGTLTYANFDSKDYSSNTEKVILSLQANLSL